MVRRAVLALLAACLPAFALADGIGVVPVLGQYQFVREDTGATFLPRGMNYVRLDDGDPTVQDTFDPATYDAGAVEQALRGMELSGYNVVRITLDSRYLVWYGQYLPATGIDSAFAAILTDFLQRATYHGLRVLIALRALPDNYARFLPPSPWNVTGANQEFFNPAFAQMRARFWVDLLAAIPRPLRASIFSLDLFDEAYASTTDLPFSGSGWFSFNGAPYRMFVAADRQALLDAATAQWAGIVVAAVKAADPDMLLTVSVATPVQQGHPGYDGLDGSVGTSNQYPLRLSVLANATGLDFVDVHSYPLGPGYSSDTDFASAGLTPAGILPKPLIMSEYGLVRGLYPDPAAGQAFLLGHLRASCGYGFTGWIMWDWDTTEGGDIWWAALQNDQALNNALAPVSWPTLCAPIPASNAVVSIAGAGMIVASNGADFCAYDSWQRFLSVTGLNGPQAAAYVGTLATYTRIPPGMRYGGICGVW